MGTQSSAYSQLTLQLTSSSIIMKFLLCVPALLTIAAAGPPPPIPPTYAPPSPPPGYGPHPGYPMPPQPQPHPLFPYMLMNLLKDSNNGVNSNNNFQRMMLLQHFFGGGVGGHSHGGLGNPLSHPLIMNSLLNQQCTEPVADCTIPNNNNGIPCGSSPTTQWNDADIKPCCKCTSQ